ncbi:MAG: hypothetical protein WB643_12925 [Candidatus Bathyarchaeia archaeon]
MNQEEKIATGVYLPRQIIEAIDLKRGRISRSTYITILLERLLLKGRKTKAA